MNNRYLDKKGKAEYKEVTLRSVDKAVFDYFNKSLKLSVQNPSGEKKVEVMFATGERWATIRKKNFRDENNTLILPLISILRTDIDRIPGFGGMAQETREIVIRKNIHKKTSNLQNLYEDRRTNGFPEPLRSDKVIYEYVTVPFPDFGSALYTITIWSQYQQHMNKILEKIFYTYNWNDSFVMPLEYDGDEPKGNSYYFVGFREGSSLPSQSNFEEFSDTERIIKYVYNIKVPFYLLLDPKTDSLSYGRDEEGKSVAYKYQNRPIISLKEKVISSEEFDKLFGDK